MSSSEDDIVISGVAPDDADPGEADGSRQDSAPKPSPPTDDVKNLRRELTNKGTQVKQYEAIFQYMDENPHLTFEQVKRIAAGEKIDTAKPSKVDEIVKRFESEGTQGAMRELADAIRDEVRAEFAPRVADAQRLRAEAEQERLLRVNGIDPFDRGFVEARSELEDKRYHALMRSDPQEAVAYLAEKWQNYSGDTDTGRKRRVDEAKQVSLASGSTRRKVQSQDIADVKFDRSKVRMADMYEALKAKQRVALVNGRSN